MADRTPRKCLHAGCSLLGSWPSGRCLEHENAARIAQNSARARRDPVPRSDWERFRQLLFAQGNVICQRVVDGRRCTRPVHAFHHILERESYPDLALDWRNVVGVCESHHQRPHDLDQGTYVPTLYRAPMSDEPRPEWEVQPGELVLRGAVLWDRAERMKALLGC